MISNALKNVFDALDYRDDKGLVTADTSRVGDGRAYVWQEIRDKLDLDAAYFHGNVPAVYFKEIENVNDDFLWDLHRSLWNHNRVPLLIVVLPSEVRVYNCFAPPVPDADRLTQDNPALLKRVVQEVSDVLAVRHELSDYRRQEIVSGRFVRSNMTRFDREQRVDNRLLGNLNDVRKILIGDDSSDNGLSESVANSLLGRAIFVRYLEDRGVIDGDYFQRFANGRSFKELLESSHHETYELFDDLADRFNGDLFPIHDLELNQVKPRHLQRLGRFLSGDEVISGQMFFWAYDFKYIPIELISAIYETFLDEDRRNKSAYYTPPEIVEFVLDEVLPFEQETHEVRILDPACGSGIFLVEAYRRLVMLQRRAVGDKNLSFEELRDLLVGSIYGVDLSEEAIQVAAFSCYLALLDFLEPKSIWESVHFPNLKGTNLFVNDFFETDAQFNELRYDIILGNPPWRNRLTGPANDYVRRNERPIGGKQIAQAFLWRATELLRDDGRSCLLAHSKAVLFNQSGPHREFRRRFFTENQVTQIVDFSAFRRSLFREAVAPMVAVFCQRLGEGEDASQELSYFNQHPSPLSETLSGVVVFGDDVKRFSRSQVADHPYIWKVALWGSPRDLTLINDLCERFPSLEQVGLKRNWLIRTGVEVSGSPKHSVPALGAMRYVPAESVQPFRVSSGHEERINSIEFHRPRVIELFRGPHVLIRRGVLTPGLLASAFLPNDAVFKNGIFGIAGPREDTQYLKIACAYINSSLARYYHFLTAGTWGIERDEVLLNEQKRFPCAIPVEDAELLSELVSLVDRIQKSELDWDWQPELDELVYESYGITQSERQLIEDFLATTMERHYLRSHASEFTPVSTQDLEHYAEAFAEVFENTIGGGRALQPTVYDAYSPYRAVSFLLGPKSASGKEVLISSEPQLDELLGKLERIATTQSAQSLFFMRNIKVYESQSIHIVKPAERRFWTRSAAYNDADETIAQLLRTLSPESNGTSAHTI